MKDSICKHLFNINWYNISILCQCFDLLVGREEELPACKILLQQFPEVLSWVPGGPNLE